MSWVEVRPSQHKNVDAGMEITLSLQLPLPLTEEGFVRSTKGLSFLSSAGVANGNGNDKQDDR